MPGPIDYKAVFKASANAYMLLDRDLRYVDANAAYLELTASKLSDLVGKHIFEAFPNEPGAPDDVSATRQLLDEVMHTGKAFRGHGMVVTLDRGARGPEEVMLDFVYQPIVSSTGSVIGVLVQGNDVTKNHRQQRRQRFLTHAGECLASAPRDLDGSLRQVARTAVREFADWATVDLLDSGQFRRVVVATAAPADAPLAEAAMRFAPSAATPSRMPHTIMDNKSTLIEPWDEDIASQFALNPEHLALIRQMRVHSVLVVPLLAGSHHYGAISFGLSKPARRFDESDVAAVDELGRMIAIAIDNARLSREHSELLLREQSARERAEAANQAKDEFLAMLGHELRNPLAPILTALQLMKLHNHGEPSREQVIIERHANHMLRLVDDLLDVSRIARGKIELRKAPTELGSAVASAVEIASPLLERQRHELRLDVPREGLCVFGDEARLSQAIANLLTNAARYTPAGGKICLRAFWEHESVILRVTDNGIGIGPELLPRIFELFVQGPQYSDRAEGGLGLGLTLVRTLVTLHGGTVEARSAGKDRGSEFEIRLPAWQQPAAEEPKSDEPSHLPTARSACKVLIVDDNVDAAELLAELLERRGHQTAIAFDGPSALTEAQSFQPAIAILDIGLPVMDGYELAARLRAASGEHAPHLIALTGYGHEHDRARSLAAGFLAHLVKPVDAELLLHTLDSALQLQEA